VKADLPFDTYEHVLPVTRQDEGMALPLLLVSAHNHLYAFAVLSLLVSLGVAFSPGLGAIRGLLVAGAFGGALLDVASWLLTREFGEPWQYAVLAGGGLFGGCVAAMGALVLDEVVLSGRVASAIRRVVTRREPSA
jgi:hypothetical protein